MAVDQASTIDIVGVDKQTGEVILTISDHLEWDTKGEHLLVLQEKINTYLSFVESGEILEQYPDSKGRKAVIRVVNLHAPNDQGREFLLAAKEIVEGAGIGFQFETAS